MGMWHRGPTRRIVDDHGDQRLARNVGYRLLKIRRDFVADIMREGAAIAMAMAADAAPMIVRIVMALRPIEDSCT